MYIHIHARARKTSKIGCFLPFLTPKSSKHTEVAQNRQIFAQWYNYPHQTQKRVRELKNGFYDNSAISHALRIFFFSFFDFFLFEKTTVCTILFAFEFTPVPVYTFYIAFVYCGLPL